MNIMEASGAGTNPNRAGDGTGLNLGADAETLALFASLFAMMQTTTGDPASLQTSPSENVPSVDSLNADAAMQSGGPMDRLGLPAAAMLMAEGPLKVRMAVTAETAAIESQTDDMPAEDIAGLDLAGASKAAEIPADAASLVRLLLMARDIAAPDQTPSRENTAPVEPAAAAQGRTATEMLTGAIEILRALEPATRNADSAAAPHENVAQDHPEQKQLAVLMPPPSDEFIGPMPRVATVSPATASPVPVSPNAPSDEFVGPMPLVTVAAPSVPLVLAAPSADFVGPMPALAAAPPAPVVLAAPSANFVGPMPAMPGSGGEGDGTPANSDQAVRLLATQQESTGRTVGVDGQGSSEIIGRQFVKKTAQASSKPASAPAGVRLTPQVEPQIAAQINSPAAAQTRAGHTSPSQYSAAANATTGVGATTSESATAASSQQAGGQSGGQSGGHSGGQSGGQSGAQQSMHQSVDAGASRGNADRTLMHRLNTESAGWSAAMVKRLTADLRGGEQNVRIILEPQHLGRLNVELGLRNGRASIRIAAETQEAAKLLSGARGQLGQMLENAGMRLANFQATGSGGEAATDPGHGGEGKASQNGSKNTGGNKDFSNKIVTASDDTVGEPNMPESGLREGETAVLSILA